jgi:uncharacterized protein YcbK (DUF882 family)
MLIIQRDNKAAINKRHRKYKGSGEMKKPHAAVSRRFVLGGLLAAPFVIRPAEAASRARGLWLHHLHTEEALPVTYWRNGRYDKGAMREIDEFMRDWRTGGIYHMDPRNLDTLHRACQRLGASGKVEIFCGYRSPETNAKLRRASSGVAKRSYHLVGQAIDFRLPDRSLRDTRRALLAYQTGGVGMYSRSDFIHIDTGPVRSWGR